MKRWFATHRWLGRLLSPLLALSATTGAILLWLQPLPAPPQQAPTVAAVAAAIDRGLDELKDGQPELRFTYIDLPRTAATGARVRLSPRDGQGEEFWADLDPVSGALLSLSSDQTNPHDWILRLHYELRSPAAGSWILGAVALLTLVSLAVALRLWLRVRRLRAPTKWRLWHRRVGITLLAPLLVTLATGFALSWPEAIRSPLAWATGEARFIPPRSPAAGAPTSVSAGQALLVGSEQLPGGIPTRLYAPKSGAYRLRLRTDEWHPNGLNSVYIDGSTARTLQVVTWRQLPWSTRYANYVYPLHIAWLPGPAMALPSILARVVWTLTALALIFMVVSGLPWRRFRRWVASAPQSHA